MPSLQIKPEAADVKKNYRRGTAAETAVPRVIVRRG